MNKTVSLKRWLKKETSVDVDLFNKVATENNENWIEKFSDMDPKDWISSAFPWDEIEQDGVDWFNISLDWEKKVKETKRGVPIITGWVKDPGEGKRTYCIKCLSEQSFFYNDYDSYWECGKCAASMADGIIERDLEIEVLRAQLGLCEQKNETLVEDKPKEVLYTVFLRQEVKETEEVKLEIYATSLSEAVDRATERYDNGEINDVDFKSIGERDLTLVNSDEWLVAKNEFHYSIKTIEGSANLYFEHKVYGEKDSVLIEIKGSKAVNYDGAMSVNKSILDYLKRIKIDTSLIKES